MRSVIVLKWLICGILLAAAITCMLMWPPIHQSGPPVAQAQENGIAANTPPPTEHQIDTVVELTRIMFETGATWAEVWDAYERYASAVVERQSGLAQAATEQLIHDLRSR